MSSFELRMTPSRGLPSPSSPPPSVALFVFIVKGKELKEHRREWTAEERTPSHSPEVITVTVSGGSVRKSSSK